MALFLPDYSTVIYHVPKCGGMWVEEACLRAGLAIIHLPSPRDPSRADRHLTPAMRPLACDLTACFVRHPIAWYESWWKYHVGVPHNWQDWPWHPTHRLNAIREMDFNRWVDRMVDAGGLYGELLSHYTGPLDAPTCGFIGRVERMADDFLRLLAAIDHPVDPEVIRQLKPIHRTPSKVGAPVWQDAQRRAVERCEQQIINTWYTA
jgi:hypothetical protein